MSSNTDYVTVACGIRFRCRNPSHGLKPTASFLALCNVNGTFRAVDNTCPHAGGPLGEGCLEGDRIEMSLARVAIERVHWRAAGES